jgi:hypothetical protein
MVGVNRISIVLALFAASFGGYTGTDTAEYDVSRA